MFAAGCTLRSIFSRSNKPSVLNHISLTWSSRGFIDSAAMRRVCETTSILPESKSTDGPTVTCLFHHMTGTCSYVVTDNAGHCAIVDPATDFDSARGDVSYEHADQILQFVKEEQLTVDCILETHAHADHISAAPYLKGRLARFNPHVGIGSHITDVQKTFSDIFCLENTDCKCDGSDFDRLYSDNEEFKFGQQSGRVIWTPGHTNDSVSYVFGDAVFSGDTLFLPDVGSGRCDFPMGSAVQMWDSVQKLFKLPDSTRDFVCHDYPKKRDPQCETTIGDQKTENIHFKDRSKKDYIELREARDKTLNIPKNLYQSLQCNIRAGLLPEPNKRGKRFWLVPCKVVFPDKA